jgi:flagellar protein FliS
MLNTMPNANAYARYKQSSIETASPEKLLLMLFDGGIKFLNLGNLAIEQKDYSSANKWFVKVQDILSELMVSLDIDKGGEIASNLYKLYEFYRNEVVKANITKNAELLPPVLEFFRLYRDMWAEAARTVRIGAK